MNDLLFPVDINDKFYQQFDDPHRAWSNLPSLYRFYLDNPDYPEPIKGEMNYMTYAYNLALKTRYNNDYTK